MTNLEATNEALWAIAEELTYIHASLTRLEQKGLYVRARVQNTKVK